MLPSSPVLPFSTDDFLLLLLISATPVVVDGVGNFDFVEAAGVGDVDRLFTVAADALCGLLGVGLRLWLSRLLGLPLSSPFLDARNWGGAGVGL